MPKEEWGTKRLCPNCSTRFYDLNNDPMTCPACGTTFTVESLQAGRGRSLVSEKTSTRGSAKSTQSDDDADTDTDLDDDAGDVDIDDDLLEDDDDDDVSLEDIADVADGDEES